ncbi:MAG: hypothetical protein IH983_10640 [Planctomycetes bacterium]|nr:hypothetical protein [Planctomycetota bacterium]
MRLRNKTIGLMAVVLSAGFGDRVAVGGVVEYFDSDEWVKAVGEGNFLTVDFVGFPNGTFITDQYADLGILFTDGNDSIAFAGSFINDGVGLDGNGNISVSFDTPQAWIGVDFPGFLTIELFSAGKLIHTTEFGSAGVGNFGGLISSKLFDAAVLVDPLGRDAEIDDLHFGVPAPGSVCLLVLAGLYPRGRRRG